jgi:hypothetical protein
MQAELQRALAAIDTRFGEIGSILKSLQEKP